MGRKRKTVLARAFPGWDDAPVMSEAEALARIPTGGCSWADENNAANFAHFPDLGYVPVTVTSPTFHPYNDLWRVM